MSGTIQEGRKGKSDGWGENVKMTFDLVVGHTHHRLCLSLSARPSVPWPTASLSGRSGILGGDGS